MLGHEKGNGSSFPSPAPLLLRSPRFQCPTGLDQPPRELRAILSPQPFTPQTFGHVLSERFILSRTRRITGFVTLLYALFPPLPVSLPMPVAETVLTGDFDPCAIHRKPMRCLVVRFCGG